MISWLAGYSQQPVILIKSFEYIYQKDFETLSPPAGTRIIVLLNDSAKLYVKNSFARAIQHRWNMAFPEVAMTVKPLPLFAVRPKFKTVVKNKEPGIWYLFLQVYDKGTLAEFIGEMASTTTLLELKCKILDGNNDSVIIERTLTVGINNEPSPPDQVPLTRLPAYPMAFMHGFDSIATWLFQPEPIDQKSLRLRPAFVFEEAIVKEKPIKTLVFTSNKESVHHLSTPSFSFNTPGPNYHKNDAKKHRVGNFASGALTVFTGLGTSKRRSFEYTADYPFEEGDSIYHCFISFNEEETAERTRERNNGGSFSINSTNYKILARYIDSTAVNVITFGADTLSTFSISYENEADAQSKNTLMWDGTDSITITLLPPEWKNKNKETRILIKGSIGSDSFTMKTLKDTRIKEFYINDQLVIIMQGKDKPVKAFAFQSISPYQLKLFSILSSLPYDYFNVGPTF